MKEHTNVTYIINILSLLLKFVKFPSYSFTSSVSLYSLSDQFNKKMGLNSWHLEFLICVAKFNEKARYVLLHFVSKQLLNIFKKNHKCEKALEVKAEIRKQNYYILNLKNWLSIFPSKKQNIKVYI